MSCEALLRLNHLLKTSLYDTLCSRQVQMETRSYVSWVYQQLGGADHAVRWLPPDPLRLWYGVDVAGLLFLMSFNASLRLERPVWTRMSLENVDF